MNELFVKIRFLLPSLPRAEKVIAEALLENPEAITHMTLAEISWSPAAARHRSYGFASGWGMRAIRR